VQSLPETNTGEPTFLLDFVKWGIASYPANRYMLILWNHGSGWDDTDVYARLGVRNGRLYRPGRIRNAFFKSSVRKAAEFSARNPHLARAIAFDDDAKDFLDSLEMKKVLADIRKLLGRKLDILGMDACLMSMAEIAYQIRESVGFMVGSEETEPVDGWPYHSIIEILTSTPELSPRDLSKTIVSTYIESYKGSGEDVTQSAGDVSVALRVAVAVKKLAEALTTGLGDTRTRNLMAGIRNQVQEYYIPENIDLVDYCTLLKGSGVGSEIKTACDGVINAVKKTKGFIVSSGYLGSSMKRSNGLAIYFPTRNISELYAKLEFAKKTRWGDFLKAYIKATRAR
jgi:hypothetical protein